MRYLGIDFGTTFTKAAIFDTDTGKTTLVELNSTNDDFGFGRTKYALPTVVVVNVSSYNRTYEVGLKALNMRLFPGSYCFENFKPALDNEEEFAQKNPNITYTELISAILRHVYTSAKSQVLSDFDRIVLTVPASTVKDAPRWNRMIEAVRNVISSTLPVDIIYEPEAAGFALLNESIKSDKSLNENTFVVYDLGGGTFDASVFQVIDEQIFVVGESVGSDDQRRWGGIYIDDILRRDYREHGSIINKMVANFKKSDLRQQKMIEEMLRVEPTKAKIALSSSDKYNYSLLDYTLTRNHFDELIRPMIEETIKSTKDLIKAKEDEGLKIKISDVKRLFLVGGSSRIKIISSLWNQERSGDIKFDIRYANIEIVAIGAAQYNNLRINSDRLIELGIIRLYDGDYNRAALYFRNANTQMGNYLLGLLYFEGLIGDKRNYAMAVKYFKLSDNENSNAMLARCAFQGRQGLPRNHFMAKEFLDKGGDLNLTNKLKEALSSSPSQFLLDEIYNFNPIKDILANFDIPKLKREGEGKSSAVQTTSNSSEREVPPCDPELDYLVLMSRFYNRE